MALRVAAESGVRPLNWLLSAGRYWNGGEFRYSPDFEVARSLGGLLFLDSGAQQFYSKFNGLDYPYTPRQYLDLALRVGADYVATPDLPLDILVPRGLPVASGIKRTVELGVETIALAEDAGILDKVVPVLQGYNDPSQWLECLDQYREHGVTPQRFKYWGLGSLCMARSTRLVESVVKAVRQVLGSDGKIHVFGISMSSQKGVQPYRQLRHVGVGVLGQGKRRGPHVEQEEEGVHTPKPERGPQVSHRGPDRAEPKESSRDAQRPVPLENNKAP